MHINTLSSTAVKVVYWNDISHESANIFKGSEIEIRIALLFVNLSIKFPINYVNSSILMPFRLSEYINIVSSHRNYISNNKKFCCGCVKMYIWRRASSNFNPSMDK